MNRQTQGVVLLLFGGAILKAAITDLYLRYVKEGLRPFLLAVGAVLVAAAVMTLWHDLRPSARVEQAQGDGRGRARHEPRVGWLLILPVLGLLLVAPPALGSYTAGQAGSVPVAQRSDSDYPALPRVDPAPISLLDYASRSIFDGGRSLAGRQLRLTGFLSPTPDGSPMLTRIVLTCCAADGRPIKIGLTGNAPTRLPVGAWVQIVGVYNPKVGRDPVNRAEVAYVEVRRWQEVRPPKRQYE